jgi:hypothetical protein
VFGRERAQRAGSAGRPAWTAGELNALNGIRNFLTRVKGQNSITAGAYEVFFASDRDGLLAAIERCPELLTDQGAAFFEVVTLMAQMLGEPRVTEAIRDRQASVQAIREARV